MEGTKSVNETRNSRYRKIFEKPISKITDILVKIPHISANKITVAGTVSVLLGGALKALPENIINSDLGISLIALGLIGIGAMADGFDGAVARRLGISSVDGALLDMMMDRIQESGLAFSRMVAAFFRNDDLGIAAATAAGITNPLTSYTRALAEEKGGSVSEAGEKFPATIGNRFPRAIMNTPATIFPEPQNIPLQNILDTMATIGNLAATLERYGKCKKIPKIIGPLTKDQYTAAKKKELMKKFIPVNTIILGMTAIGLIGIKNLGRS